MTTEPTKRTLLAGALIAVALNAAAADRLNILFITADDLNFNSVGVYGCPVEGLTPNLDRLAAEGMLFRQAYSNVTVCQPVRQTMHTGLYPHRSGSVGNGHPLQPDVVTLNERLDYFGTTSTWRPGSAAWRGAKRLCSQRQYTSRQACRTSRPRTSWSRSKAIFGAWISPVLSIAC